MIINGIDLSQVKENQSGPKVPATVKGRVLHIDADFLAYMMSYEKEGNHIPFEDMCFNVKGQVEKMRLMAGAESVFLHLTPGTSDKGGRGAIAIQKEYQGNRKDRDRPEKLHILREWMGKNYPAQLYHDCEADDGMSSAQWAMVRNGFRERSVICSKDKDLLMVPGWHMDWDTFELAQSVDETGNPNEFGYTYLDSSKSASKIKGFGTKFFWGQMLTGDTADNIAGLPFVCGKHLSKPKKIGPVLADYYLSDLWNDKDAFNLVKGLYEACGQEVGFKHWSTGENVPWQRVFVAEAQLLWMRRDRLDAQCVLKWFKEIMS